MAVLVKTDGRFGDAYMAAIRPFRHALVYPAMMRRIGRSWDARPCLRVRRRRRGAHAPAPPCSRPPHAGSHATATAT